MEGGDDFVKSSSHALRAKRQSAQPVQGCKQNAVLSDIGSELIEPDLHGQDSAVASLHLVTEPYLAADDTEGLFLGPVTVEKPQAGCPSDQLPERRRDRLQKRVPQIVRNHFGPPHRWVDAVGKDEEEPVEWELGPNVNDRMAKAYNANMRFGRELVEALHTEGGLDPHVGGETSQALHLVWCKPDGSGAFVFPK